MTIVPEEPLQINDKCQVQWRDDGGQLLDAVVIERRPLGHRKRKKNDPIPDLSTLKADEIEYYVHYVAHDRYVDLLLLEHTSREYCHSHFNIIS